MAGHDRGRIGPPPARRPPSPRVGTRTCHRGHGRLLSLPSSAAYPRATVPKFGKLASWRHSCVSRSGHGICSCSIRITAPHDACARRGPAAPGDAGSSATVRGGKPYPGGESAGMRSEAVASSRSGNARAAGWAAGRRAGYCARGELPAAWNGWKVVSAGAGPGYARKCLGNYEASGGLDDPRSSSRRACCAGRRSGQEKKLAVFAILAARRSTSGTALVLRAADSVTDALDHEKA